MSEEKSTWNFVDLTNKKFERLQVLELERKERRKAGGTRLFWKCLCDCGNIVVIEGRNLKSGHTKSCGCLRDEKARIFPLKDLTGQKFNHLTVIERAERPKGYKTGCAYWKCVCDCGNPKILIVRGDGLKQGRVKSCGCVYDQYVLNFQEEIKGLKFGRLTVIERVFDHKFMKFTKGFHVKCICDCGNEIVTTIDALRKGQLFSCGCDRQWRVRPLIITDITDKRFGNLVAIKMVERPEGFKKGVYWLCKCDCGNEEPIRINELLEKETISCHKCWDIKFRDLKKNMSRKDYGLSSFNKVYKSYITNAKNRSLEFKLSKEDFKNLIFQNCYYCDAKPSNVVKNETDNGDCIYNGLDRVNTNLGYTIDNVVPCCTKCNVAKWNMGEQEFYAWISRVYNHIKENNRLSA